MLAFKILFMQIENESFIQESTDALSTILLLSVSVESLLRNTQGNTASITLVQLSQLSCVLEVSRALPNEKSSYD